MTNRTKRSEAQRSRARWKAGLTGLALLCGLSFSAGCGGGGGTTFQGASNNTLGKELQDLQESYDKGIITEKQYNDTKKRLIKKYTE